MRYAKYMKCIHSEKTYYCANKRNPYKRAKYVTDAYVDISWKIARAIYKSIRIRMIYKTEEQAVSSSVNLFNMLHNFIANRCCVNALKNVVQFN